MLRVLVLAIALVFSGEVLAASQAGQIKTVEGEAAVVRGGKTLKAEPGMAVRSSDVLKTGKDGSLGVTFRDKAMISLGPDTEIAVEKYLFEPRKKKLAFVSRMSRGTAQFVSGTIAKLAPSKVAVKTPTGTIGVRGTRFVVKAGE